MINLLNPAELHELKAARVNVRLRRFAVLTFLTLGVIGSIYLFSFRTASVRYDEAIAKSSASDQELKEYESVKATAKEYQTNLTIAKKILGSEITFSAFITELASSLPPSTILSDLSLSTKSIGLTNGKATITQLSARAKGYSDVIALKSSLEKKTNLFSEVRITSTSLSDITGSSDALTRAYPYTVTFSVVLAAQGGTK